MLTRIDLKRAASELGLGTRIGERAFDLESLIEQDCHGVIEWMASEARRQADLYSSAPMTPTIGVVWSERANRTHAVLNDLAG